MLIKYFLLSMISNIKSKISENVELFLVLCMTTLILTCFSFDVLSQPANNTQIQPPHLPISSPIPAKQQPNIKYQHTLPYQGIAIERVQDWGNRNQIQKSLTEPSNLVQPVQPTTYRPAPTPTPTPSPSPSTTTNSAYHPPTPTTNMPIRSKAGISSEQAAQAKKFIELKNIDADSELAIQEKTYFEEKYKVSEYKELPFCVVVPSYKNVANDRYRHNMNSIIQQDYSNYRIIFIDDASEDDTGNFMKQYIKQHNLSDEKITVVINKERQMAMPNLHWAAHKFCKPYQIFMIVDGDDELVGKQVFKHFNSIFSSQDVWVAYTNFISIRGSIGYSRPFSQTTMDKNSYRRSAFVISHLRAFYTKLFALIKEQDLRDEEGKWFRAANDVAMYLPILEMAHKRVVYAPEVSYMYNSNTGLNNHRVKLREQKGNERKIKTKPAYEEVKEIFTDEEMKEWKENTGKVIPLKKQVSEEPVQQNQPIEVQ